MTATKTMQNRLVTVRKQLADLRARIAPLEKEERKIIAFLEEDAHDSNAAELGIGKQNEEASKSDLTGLDSDRLAEVKKHGKK